LFFSKHNIKHAAAASALLLTLPAISAYAEEDIPSEGIGRISWAMRCAGAMPKGMIIGLIAIAAMIVITILVSRLTDKEETDK
jgi:hypothetical protein